MGIGSQPGSGTGVVPAERVEENKKIKILNKELEQFAGKKKTSEVLDYITREYGGEYNIPGIEYRDYLIENPDKVPEEMKDGGFYLFVGSTIKDKGSRSFVPVARWRNKEEALKIEAGLYPTSYMLDSYWPIGNRVLLVEK
jgi:hypothetical protein